MAADPTAVQSTFVSSVRNASKELLTARLALKNLREIAITQGYPANFVSGAFGGTNGDLVAADLTAFFAAMDALEQVLTNFATTPPTPTASLGAIQKFALAGS